MGALGGSGRKISCIFWYMLDTMLSAPLDASEAAVPPPLLIMSELVLVVLSLSGILLRIELLIYFLASTCHGSQALHLWQTQRATQRRVSIPDIYGQIRATEE